MKRNYFSKSWMLIAVFLLFQYPAKLNAQQNFDISVRLSETNINSALAAITIIPNISIPVFFGQ